MEVRLRDSDWLAREVYLPLVKLTSPAVVLGSGERFARDDDAAKSRCMRIANNIYSPPVAVVEGHRGVLGLWPEPASFGYDDLTLAHQPECDELVPQVCLAFNAKDPDTANEPGVTRSSWWRMAAFPPGWTWPNAIAPQLEQRSGVKPLWEQTPAWVRSIHAVCTERPHDQGPGPGRQVLRGSGGAVRPQQAAAVLLERQLHLAVRRSSLHDRVPVSHARGDRGAAETRISLARLPSLRAGVFAPGADSPPGGNSQPRVRRARRVRLPAGLCRAPEAAAFYDYFRPVAAGYYAKLEDSLSLWTLHPGTQLVRDYLCRNVGNYCRQHGMSGCYFDILGADHAGQCLDNAPSDRRIMEGNDWRRGEELACRAIKAANPDLAVMSEVQGDWTTVHTFYTWEGESHLTHPQPVRLNHPLRAACWGSYTWTQTDSPEAVALLAGLPAVKLADDWSVARGKLYMDEELFHDLPDQWDPDALAYFRARADAGSSTAGCPGDMPTSSRRAAASGAVQPTLSPTRGCDWAGWCSRPLFPVAAGADSRLGGLPGRPAHRIESGAELQLHHGAADGRRVRVADGLAAGVHGSPRFVIAPQQSVIEFGRGALIPRRPKSKFSSTAIASPSGTRRETTPAHFRPVRRPSSPRGCPAAWCLCGRSRSRWTARFTSNFWEAPAISMPTAFLTTGGPTTAPSAARRSRSTSRTRPRRSWNWAPGCTAPGATNGLNWRPTASRSCVSISAIPRARIPSSVRPGR